MCCSTGNCCSDGKEIVAGVKNARLEGVAASEGVAVGPLFRYRPQTLEPERTSIRREDVGREIERFHASVERVIQRIRRTKEELERGGSHEEAGILEAHIELAEDPELSSEVERKVREDLKSPEVALLESAEEFASLFEGMEDEYLRARADDVRDVCRQIASEIMGVSSSSLFLRMEGPSVVVAQNLAPSETATLPKEKVLALVTAEGSKTSHVAIMARSMGIPAVVGLGGEAIEELSSASVVAVDGGEGYVVADPDPEELALFEEKERLVSAERESLEAFRHVLARTRSGRRIEVSANLGSPEEAEGALRWGAEGVGLFRTEFLFMQRESLPEEEEQYGAYAAVARAFSGRPVIVRTLDVGGDKDLPGIEQPEEDNPFLGWRGIRMSLDEPELFKVQIRALLRAATEGNLKVMFPMVTGVEEVKRARRLIKECEGELEAEGKPKGELEVGVMIETPAAALCAEELAEEVSFFSVGTNDLVQYTLAVDRGNEKLKKLYRADHPAVLKLIETTCRAAEEGGIWVGVCGEAASDPDLIPTLVGLGVSELSMSPPSIPRAKKVISELP
ncbi:MAG: phosphoenolpyruvate--protein phosphotransferase [Rubrobacteraceae bacterium]|nr:phosphoenolpyruvate--protein phosphotransferase [Rubrobacteraceae bacterium]